MKVIIAAAGTAGHINPGISIANKIMQEEPSSEIIFIGTNRGLEKDLVSRAGYKLETIDAYGLTLSNITKIFKILKGFREAKKIIKDFKPDIVIGTGGYICGAVITQAHKLHIPTMLHESNAFPGKAVKMLAKSTDTILVAFEDAKERINGAKKIVVTGTPTKIKSLNLSQDEKNRKIKEIGLSEEKPILLVFGGSQGAKAINDAILKLINDKKIKDYQMIWAPGPKQYEIIKEELMKKGTDIDNIPQVKIYSYIYNMEEMMNIADLIICRSGAMTVTEVAKVGKVAIFVPLPGVSQNHQEYNAKVLEKRGAAKIILNKDLETIDLNQYIEELILNKSLLNEMENKSKDVSLNDVEDKIYKEIKELL